MTKKNARVDPSLFSARRLHSCGRRFSIIPYLQQFVNRQNKQNNHPRKSRICATLLIDFWCSLWYTIIVKREAVSNQRNGKLMAPMGDCVETGQPFQPIPAESSPKGIKKLKKPLDKSKFLCYNLMFVLQYGNTIKGEFPSFLLDVLRLNFSRSKSSYMTKFLKILLDKKRKL